MRTKLFAILALSTAVPCSIFGQEAQTQLEYRVKFLEEQNGLIDKRIELIKQEVNNAQKSDIAELKNQLAANNIENETRNRNANIILGVFGLGIVSILLASLAKFKTYVGGIVEEKALKLVNERVNSIIENSKGQIIELINSQDLEAQVKENSKLLIVSDSEGTASDTKKLLHKLGLKYVEIATSNKFVNPAYNFDLIILDDHKLTKAHHDVFREYTEKINSYFVFYGDRFEATKRDRLNFSNTEFTLYSQIISTLKFKKLYDK